MKELAEERRKGGKEGRHVTWSEESDVEKARKMERGRAEGAQSQLVTVRKRRTKMTTKARPNPILTSSSEADREARSEREKVISGEVTVAVAEAEMT